MDRPPVTKKLLVYRALKERIYSLPPGAPLGKTILQLAGEFGVSDRTVRGR